MKRKKLLLIVLVVVLLTTALISQAALAEEPKPLFVLPYLRDGVPLRADADQPILIGLGWTATTKGQLVVNQKHYSQTFVLIDQDGETVLDLSADEAEAYWGPFLPRPPEDLGVDCPMPTLWRTLWGYLQEPLPPGEYTLVYTSVMTQPANDGFHTCTDTKTGQPAAPPPSLYRPGEPFVNTVTIIVDDA